MSAQSARYANTSFGFEIPTTYAQTQDHRDTINDSLVLMYDKHNSLERYSNASGNLQSENPTVIAAMVGCFEKLGKQITGQQVEYIRTEKYHVHFIQGRNANGFFMLPRTYTEQESKQASERLCKSLQDQCEYVNVEKKQARDDPNDEVTIADYNVTYNLKTGQFYIKKEQVDDALKGLKKSIANDLTFGHEGYLTGYDELSERISQRIIDKFEPVLVDRKGRIRIDPFHPSLKKEYRTDRKKYAMLEGKEKEAFKREIEKKVTKTLNLTGYWDLHEPFTKLLSRAIDESKGTDLYRDVLKTGVGDTTIATFLKQVLGKRADEFIGRNLGWGSYAFAIAHETGLHHELKDEFVNRVTEAYTHSYGKALRYVSQRHLQEDAQTRSKMAMDLVQKMPELPEGLIDSLTYQELESLPDRMFGATKEAVA